MRTRAIVSLVTVFVSIQFAAGQEAKTESGCEAIVLGIAQDAGYPQAACRKACCRDAWKDPSLRRYASCVAIVDHQSNQRWMLDCTPDFREQLRLLDETAIPEGPGVSLDGIFLTHTHIGHYTGLIHLGREVIGAKSTSVHAMPRMKLFLESNGPWDQLVKLRNISIAELAADKAIAINGRLKVTPIPVPHRDEYSETVGFLIEGPNSKLLYLPDIDKWSKWDRSINELVKQVDVALVDGTFFANGEIPGRDMKQIPHPFVQESIRHFSNLEDSVRERIYFIHLNHTNPAIRTSGPERAILRRARLGVADQGQKFGL